MSKLPALMPLTEVDYESIEGAVMETARGRWFLAEYARRNRHADTDVLLAAIGRLETAMRGERAERATPPAVDLIRFDLVEMAKSIARTRAEISTIKPDVDDHGKFGVATEELDSIVSATETATSDILAAAEQIQEIAWTLREQGLEGDACDILDARATDIYTACSFQDLTGQRTSKVIQVLRYLEARINAMIDIWGLDGATAAEAAEAARASEEAAGLLNGPALPGHGLDQTDIDMVMDPVAASDGAAAHETARITIIEAEETVIELEAEPGSSVQAPEASATAQPELVELAADATPMPLAAADEIETEVFAAAVEPSQAASPTQVEPAAAPAAEPHSKSAAAAAKALARIEALSAEEKIALFS